MTQEDGSSADTSGEEGTRRRRLPAAARKKSILDAARRAFSETGDMKGTTIRVIAETGGISEGIIYRHFESKEQLFFEAVVEPVTDAVDTLVAAAAALDQEEPLTPERRVESLRALYRQLVATLAEVLPLLGLVQFGDPEVAERFYRESLTVAMDRLAEAWQQIGARHGFDVGSYDVAARAVMGTALMEGSYTPGFDRERAIEAVTAGTLDGFFPMPGPAGGERP